jgi:menaquinone-dependent protoporphyrinogen oxidase
MIAFAKTHRDALARMGAAFVSVTLSEAGAEDPTKPADERRAAAADAQRMIDVFVNETGWRPEHALPVAGALVYSRYNFLVRFLMKRIARKAGAPTDTSRDYEFTDWAALDRFVGELAERRT